MNFNKNFYKNIFLTHFLYLFVLFILVDLFSLLYLKNLSIDKSFLSYFYLFIAFNAHSWVIVLLLFFILLIPSFLIKNIKINSLFSIFPSMCLLSFFVLDAKIYGIYKIHINYAMLKIYSNIKEFQTMEIPLILIVLFILFSFCVGVILFYSRILLHAFVVRRNVNFHWIVYSSVFLLCSGFIALDKGLLIYGYKHNKSQITKYDSLLPFYMIATSGFGDEKSNDPEVSDKSLKILNYPKYPVDTTVSHKYNIVWIVLESWNVHFFEKETMPFTSQFTTRASVFSQNISAGNSTRFGLFGLFSGLPSSYWFSFLKSRSEPFFLTVLKNNDYNMLFQMSASVKRPEFDLTLFSHIPQDLIKDISTLKGGSPAERDQSQVINMIDFINKNDEKPFFVFLFFDSSHGGYDFPEKFTKYQDYSKSVYLDADDPTKKEKIINKYKNSLYYEDYLIQEVITHLEAKNLMNDTIVVITGDHGEEMYETGVYGHNTRFNIEQSGTPLLVYVPHKEPKTYTHLTSSIDVVPTLLQIMGNHTEVNRYSLGQNLFTENTPNRNVLTCNYSLCAAYGHDLMIEFGYQMYTFSHFKVYNRNLDSVVMDADISTKQKNLLQNSMKDMSYFVE